MSWLWAFVRKPSNQRLLPWLDGGMVIVAGRIGAVVTYVWPPREAPTAVCANQGIVIGGSISSRSSVTNRITGGTTPAGPCITSTKK